MQRVAKRGRDALRTVYGRGGSSQQIVRNDAPDPRRKHCLSTRLEPSIPTSFSTTQSAPADSEGVRWTKLCGQRLFISWQAGPGVAPQGQKSTADAVLASCRCASPSIAYVRCCQRRQPAVLLDDLGPSASMRVRRVTLAGWPAEEQARKGPSHPGVSRHGFYQAVATWRQEWKSSKERKILPSSASYSRGKKPFLRSSAGALCSRRQWCGGRTLTTLRQRVCFLHGICAIVCDTHGEAEDGRTAQPVAVDGGSTLGYGIPTGPVVRFPEEIEVLGAPHTANARRGGAVVRTADLPPRAS